MGGTLDGRLPGLPRVQVRRGFHAVRAARRTRLRSGAEQRRVPAGPQRDQNVQQPSGGLGARLAVLGTGRRARILRGAGEARRLSLLRPRHRHRRLRDGSLALPDGIGAAAQRASDVQSGDDARARPGDEEGHSPGEALLRPGGGDQRRCENPRRARVDEAAADLQVRVAARGQRVQDADGAGREHRLELGSLPHHHHHDFPRNDHLLEAAAARATAQRAADE